MSNVQMYIYILTYLM